MIALMVVNLSTAYEEEDAIGGWGSRCGYVLPRYYDPAAAAPVMSSPIAGLKPIPVDAPIPPIIPDYLRELILAKCSKLVLKGLCQEECRLIRHPPYRRWCYNACEHLFGRGVYRASRM